MPRVPSIAVEVLTPPLLMAAALLVLAGAPKLVRPHAAARALAGVGLPERPLAVRGLGLAEVAAGASVIAVGGPLPALAAGLLYLGFTGFVAFAIARGGQSCGCLGSDDTPPTAVHLVIDGSLAVVALLASTASPASLADLIEGQPMLGLPLVAFLALGVWFLQLALATLPALSARVPA